MSVHCSSDLSSLFETIHKSHFVKRHVDFFEWLQNDVCKFIPHDVLVAAWGNFSKGQLHFDISSSIPEVHTQQLTNGCAEVSPLMSELFRKWENNDDRWFMFEEFSASHLSMGYSNDDKIMGELRNMSSVLVYGYRDKRGEHDILYAFFKADAQLETQTPLLSMIMPHLDAALRSVEHLANTGGKSGATIDNALSSVISERECEVLNLVLEGKTNVEIGQTLFISPNTVKNHLKSIFRKMEVSSRAEAVARYLVEFDAEHGGMAC